MLTIYLIICAAFSVLTVYSMRLCGNIVILWGIVYFLIYFVGIFVLHILLLAIMSIPVNKESAVEKDSRLYRNFAVATMRFAFEVLDVHISVEGTELLPEGRFLFVGNHRSGFDPLITLVALDKFQLGFITKPENMVLPIVGKFAHKICCLPIDRENPRNAVKTINAAAEFLKNDIVSVAIYPEGTRNRGEGLLPFHNGSFKIAVKAGVPIAVVCVKGSDKIKASSLLKRKNVCLKVLKIISAEEVSGSNTAELSEISQELLLKELEKA